MVAIFPLYAKVRTYTVNKDASIPSGVSHKEPGSVEKVASLRAYHKWIANCTVIQNLVRRCPVRLIKTAREGRHNFQVRSLCRCVYDALCLD
jgi:hypothetical protein